MTSGPNKRDELRLRAAVLAAIRRRAWHEFDREVAPLEDAVGRTQRASVGARRFWDWDLTKRYGCEYSLRRGEVAALRDHERLAYVARLLANVGSWWGRSYEFRDRPAPMYDGLRGLLYEFRDLHVEPGRPADRRLLAAVSRRPWGDFPGDSTALEEALRFALDATVPDFYLWEHRLAHRFAPAARLSEAEVVDLDDRQRLAYIAYLTRSLASCWGVPNELSPKLTLAYSGVRGLLYELSDVLDDEHAAACLKEWDDRSDDGELDAERLL